MHTVFYKYVDQALARIRGCWIALCQVILNGYLPTTLILGLTDRIRLIDGHLQQTPSGVSNQYLPIMFASPNIPVGKAVGVAIPRIAMSGVDSFVGGG